MIKHLLEKIKMLRATKGRERSVLLSILTSVGNRAIGTITQLVSFPIAVHALGIGTFSTYVMLSAVLAWLSISSIGIGPALTQSILTAKASNNRTVEAEAFGTALWLALVVGALLLFSIIFLLVSGVVRPTQVLGVSRAGPDELWALIVSALLVVVTVVTSVTDGARAGYLEMHITNMYNFAASAVSIIALLVVAWFFPTLTGMCLAVYGASALAKICSTASLVFLERPYLRLRVSQFSKGMIKKLTDSSIAFTVGQVGMLMVNQGPTLIVGWILGASAATPIGVLLGVELTLSTIVGMIAAPLWPAIADAHARDDHRWIKRAKNRLLAFTALYAGAVGIIICAFGNSLISLWLGDKIHVDVITQIAMGIYFPIWMLTYAFHMILFGIGRLWKAAGCLYVFAMAAGSFGIMLIPSLGGSGMAVGMCVGAVCSLVAYWWCAHAASLSPLSPQAT